MNCVQLIKSVPKLISFKTKQPTTLFTIFKEFSSFIMPQKILFSRFNSHNIFFRPILGDVFLPFVGLEKASQTNSQDGSIVSLIELIVDPVENWKKNRG